MIQTSLWNAGSGAPVVAAMNLASGDQRGVPLVPLGGPIERRMRVRPIAIGDHQRPKSNGGETRYAIVRPSGEYVAP